MTGEDTLLEAPPEGQRTVLAIENDVEDDEDPETDEDYDPAADSGAEDELADAAGDGDGADRTELLLHKQPCPVTKADWKLNGEHVTWQYVGQSQEALVAASLPGQVPIETAPDEQPFVPSPDLLDPAQDRSSITIEGSGGSLDTELTALMAMYPGGLAQMEQDVARLNTVATQNDSRWNSITLFDWLDFLALIAAGSRHGEPVDPKRMFADASKLETT